MDREATLTFLSAAGTVTGAPIRPQAERSCRGSR